MVRDIGLLEQIDSAAWIAEEIIGRPLRLLHDLDLRNDLLQIDFRELE